MAPKVGGGGGVYEYRHRDGVTTAMPLRPSDPESKRQAQRQRRRQRRRSPNDDGARDDEGANDRGRRGGGENGGSTGSFSEEVEGNPGSGGHVGIGIPRRQHHRQRPFQSKLKSQPQRGPTTVADFLHRQQSAQDSQSADAERSRRRLGGRRTATTSDRSIDAVSNDHPSSDVVQTMRTCTLCHRTLPRAHFSSRDRYTVHVSLAPGAVCRTCATTVSAVRLKMLPGHEEMLLGYAGRGDPTLAFRGGGGGRQRLALPGSEGTHGDANSAGRELVPFDPSRRGGSDGNSGSGSFSFDHARGHTNPAASSATDADAHEHARRIADCKYIDVLLQMECYPALARLGIFRSSRDASVSLAALDAVRLYGTVDQKYFVPLDANGELPPSEGALPPPPSVVGGRRRRPAAPILPRNILCLVVGEGSSPRTAVLANLRYGWTAWSIDENLADEWAGCDRHVERERERDGHAPPPSPTSSSRGAVTGYNGSLREFMDPGERDEAVIEYSHRAAAHLIVIAIQTEKDGLRLKGNQSINEIRDRYGDVPTTLVSMSPLRKASLAPSSAGRSGKRSSKLEKDVGYEPNCAYVDEGVFSECRLVEVWNFHNAEDEDDEDDFDHDDEFGFGSDGGYDDAEYDGEGSWSGEERGNERGGDDDGSFDERIDQRRHHYGDDKDEEYFSGEEHEEGEDDDGSILPHPGRERSQRRRSAAEDEESKEEEEVYDPFDDYELSVEEEQQRAPPSSSPPVTGGGPDSTVDRRRRIEEELLARPSQQAAREDKKKKKKKKKEEKKKRNRGRSRGKRAGSEEDEKRGGTNPVVDEGGDDHAGGSPPTEEECGGRNNVDRPTRRKAKAKVVYLGRDLTDMSIAECSDHEGFEDIEIGSGGSGESFDDFDDYYQGNDGEGCEPQRELDVKHQVWENVMDGHSSEKSGAAPAPALGKNSSATDDEGNDDPFEGGGGGGGAKVERKSRPWASSEATNAPRAFQSDHDNLFRNGSETNLHVYCDDGGSSMSSAIAELNQWDGDRASEQEEEAARVFHRRSKLEEEASKQRQGGLYRNDGGESADAFYVNDNSETNLHVYCDDGGSSTSSAIA